MRDGAAADAPEKRGLGGRGVRAQQSDQSEGGAGNMTALAVG